jgi:hypothetical protein
LVDRIVEGLINSILDLSNVSIGIFFSNSDLDIVLIMLSFWGLIKDDVSAREENIADIPCSWITVHGSEYGEIAAVSFEVQAESTS